MSIWYFGGRPLTGDSSPADIAWDKAIWYGGPDTTAFAKGIDLEGRALRDRWFTSLHCTAAGLEHEDIVDLCVRLPQRINSCDRYGRTPLFWAIYRGDMSMAKDLLNHGANPNTDTSCIVWACSEKYDEPECVQVLLDHGASPDGVDFDGYTALHACVITHRGLPFLQTLIANGADLERAYEGADSSVHGLTALGFACLYGPTANTVGLLLSHGADFRRVDHSARSALHLAVTKAPGQLGRKETAAIVRTLLDAGHGSVCTDRTGNTPADVAISVRDPESLSLLLSDKWNASVPSGQDRDTTIFGYLTKTIRTHNHEILAFFLEHYHDNIFTPVGGRGDTVLHTLAQHADHRSIVVFEEKLDFINLDPGARDTSGRIAADYLPERPEEIARTMQQLLERISNRTLENNVSTTDPALTVKRSAWSTENSVMPTASFVTKQIADVDSGYASEESRYSSDDEDAETSRPTIASTRRLPPPRSTKRRIRDLSPSSQEGMKITQDLTETLSNLYEAQQASWDGLSHSMQPSHKRPFQDTRETMILVYALLKQFPIRRLLVLLLRPKVAAGNIRITWECVRKPTHQAMYATCD